MFLTKVDMFLLKC